MATRWNIQVDVDPKGVVTGAAVAGRAVDGMGKKAVATETRMKALRTSMASVAKMAGLVLGPAMVAMFARDSIRKAVEQEKVLALVASQIRATGGAAGLSTRQIADYAAELQRATGVGDESILKSAGVLLSFKQIGGDVFKDTLRLAQDMAIVMGTDLNSAVLQLSKALADPVARLGELSRAGIVFTQAQKDMVKEMVNAGQLMEAQVFILEEIESQYGGAAKAARDTLGGALQALGSEWGDLQENLILSTGANNPIRIFVEGAISALQFLNDNMAKASAGWLLAGAKFQFFISGIMADILRMLESLPNFIQNKLDLQGLRDQIDRMQKEASGLVTKAFDTMAKSAEKLPPPIMATTRAVRELTAEEKKAADEARKMIESLEAASIKQFGDIVENAARALDKLGTVMLDVSDINLTEGLMPSPFLPEDIEQAVLSDEAAAKARERFQSIAEDFRDSVTKALAQALASGDIDNAIDGLIGALSAGVSTAVSGAVSGMSFGGASFLAPIAGGIAGGLTSQLLGGLFGDDDAEKLKEAQEAFSSLVDLVRSSMPAIRQQVIETFDTILEMLQLMQDASGVTGEEMAAVNRELQATADAITGISTSDFGDRIRAAQEFNETLLSMPQEIQDQFDAIDLSGLAESIAAEFMGITSHLELAGLQRDAQQLRSAIAGLGLDSERTAALIRQVTQAERLRVRELRSGVMAQLADLMERAGIRSAEAARLRAKYEQIQFQVALKRLEVEIKLLDMWTKATAKIIGELTEFGSSLGNFMASVSGGISGAGMNLPKVGRGGGLGGGRKQKRKDLLAELEALMNTGGASNTFADRLRELNKQFRKLRKRARKLKVPLEKVNAAYRVQLRLLREQAQSSLRQFREGLMSGPMSPLSLQQQFFRARSNFFNLQRRAAGGDLDATSQLGAAGQEYLDLARQLFGTTSQFKDIFNEVLALVDGVLGVGGLKDEEATRHDQVLSQMEQSDGLRMEFHDDAQEKRHDIFRKTRDSANILVEVRDILSRMENVA